MENERFWASLEALLDGAEIIIDRPKGGKHPKANLIYPVDYGYVKDTKSPDGEGIDVYIGSAGKYIDAVICTVDLFKRDSEIKILIGCTEDEKCEIFKIYSERFETLQGVLVRRPSAN